MHNCEACGKPNALNIVGCIALCRPCYADVMDKVDLLRAAGKPVDVLRIARKMFREEHSVGGYLLRDIPEDLWTAVKHKAVEQGLSHRDLIMTALRAYI